MIEPKKEGKKLRFANNLISIEEEYNIGLNDFLNIYENLKDKHCLKIINTYFSREETGIGIYDKRPIRDNYAKYIISFIMLCGLFEERKLNIQNLIYEFNEAQKDPTVYGIRHAFSLARLGYEYIINDYDVSYIKNISDRLSPDIKINKISADLKVRKEIDINLEFLSFYKISKFESRKNYILSINPSKHFIEEIHQANSSRRSKALTQAEMVFFDLSYRDVSFPNDVIFSQPIIPEKNKLIFYINDRCHFKPRWKFVWTYTRYNQEKADFIRDKNGKIIWGK